ncbi:MAG: MFS transporter, partial [Pseudorhodobacter sp.]
VLVKDPDPVAAGPKGSLLDLLRMPALWLILPMMAVNYLPAAGLRGLWIGPYYADVFGATASGIGMVSLVMGLAMVFGNFAYGPLDRLLGTRKWLVFWGNALGLACLIGLWMLPTAGGWVTVALLSGVGFFGASFPVIMAHGRALFPTHLIGRGVTLMNLFGIGTIGIAQLFTGYLHGMAPATPPEAAYTTLFAFFALALGFGIGIYAFSRDRTD